MSEAEISHADLVGLLQRLVELRKARKKHSDDFDDMADLFKAYLQKHPGEVIWDGEHRIEARLGETRTPESYDVFNMPDDLILRLKAKQALSVDLKIMRDLQGKDSDADAAKRWRMPGGVTQRLVIEEKEA